MTNLAEAAANEVVALHAEFMNLFTGRSSDFSRCDAVLAPDFQMVTPQGLCIERDAVLAGLRSTRTPADFQVGISDIHLVWEHVDWVLLQYVEQQYRGGRITRRRSTALFRAFGEAPCGVVWRYLHETWM
ncbi:hypothetical protein BH10PSE7_BH10PSE7_24100 [soil metagenome]